MAQKAGGPFRPVVLFGEGDRADGALRMYPLDRQEALHRLHGSKLDPDEMMRLRRWSYEQGLGVGLKDEQMLSMIAAAVVDGRIFMARPSAVGLRPVASGGGGETTLRDDRSKPQDRPSPRARPKPFAQHVTPREISTPQPEVETRTWIEFRLLDERTGKPVSGVSFRIKLTDGSIVTEVTDGNGLIRIDGITPGVCGISEIEDDTGSEVVTVE